MSTVGSDFSFIDIDKPCILDNSSKLVANQASISPYIIFDKLYNNFYLHICFKAMDFISSFNSDSLTYPNVGPNPV